MITLDEYRQLALALPDVDEHMHFEKPSFRVNKKIFATYWPREHRAMLRLPLVEQSVFCDFDPAIFFPVPGAWGAQGATLVDLKKVRKSMFKDALHTAHLFVAEKSTSSKAKKK